VPLGEGEICGFHDGAIVSLENCKFSKCLTLSSGGELTASGNHGIDATWTVEVAAPHFKLRSHAFEGKYLAFKGGQVCGLLFTFSWVQWVWVLMDMFK
jgi:hypothetical protein